MIELKALLFDVDGTLADTERDGHRIAFNQAFADAGLDWDWSVSIYGELLRVTGGKERIKFYLDKYLPDFQPPTGVPLDEYIAGLHQSKTRFYTELLKTGAIPLREGVERLLREARQAGLRLAIATTTTPANVSALLASTLGEEGESMFELIAAGDIVPAKKPASDIYDYALDKMGLRAEECLAIEDSDNGLTSARGAGLETIITVNGYTEAQDFSGAMLVLNKLGEPGDDFKVLSGDANGDSYVSADLLTRLHQRSQSN